MVEVCPLHCIILIRGVVVSVTRKFTIQKSTSFATIKCPCTRYAREPKILPPPTHLFLTHCIIHIIGVVVSVRESSPPLKRVQAGPHDYDE